MHEGLLFQDREGRIVEYNAAAGRILDLDGTALHHRPEDLGPRSVLSEAGAPLPPTAQPPAVALRTGTPVVGAVVGVGRPDGRTVWCRVNSIPVFDDRGEPDGVISTFTDITAERVAQSALASSEAAANVAAQALSWQTLHDPLTELPNRAQLAEHLARAVDRTSHRGGTVAVLVLDLDRFKHVNDTLGHDAGDTVLREVAARLRGAVRARDVVGRLAGDEFVVLAEALEDRAEALHLAERLRGIVARPVPLPGGTITLTTCVGIAFDVDHRPGPLLRDAETALHKAKERGRDCCEVFDDSLRAEAIRRASAERLLRQALDEDGLRVLYQPIVDLHTGATVSAEALLRVLGPSGEVLAPSTFITIAEDTGLIVPVGAGVLDDACKQMARWRDAAASAPASVSVNVSARQITTRAFSAVVERALASHDLAPAAVTLELTETTLIEAGHMAIETLAELHELGVRLAIDDFGTGYSSLSYLKRFPVDIVKIDRSFVAGLGVDQHDTEIVRAVLALGQSLGLTTVAEGVETLDQLGLLRELGCDRAQGYLLARPLPADDLLAHARTIRALVGAPGDPDLCPAAAGD
jgi:diguanylate cyclase (GGDEF)-like protein